MNKNTLYITFDGLSDPLGQSQILPYLCGIAKNGCHIHILSCEKKDRLQTEKAKIESLLREVPVSWEYIIYDPHSGFFSRYSYVRKITALGEKILKQKKIALVHCRSYLASLIGLDFKRRFNIPFVFDMRGFWADERIDGNIWSKKNPVELFFYRYFKRRERKFLEEADAIVSLTNAAVKELAKKFPEFHLITKTTVIPCCTDTNLFDAGRTPQIKFNKISPGDHVIIYTGSIGTWYYTREIIDCVLCWKELIPNLKLLILTKDIPELEKITDTYSSGEKESIIYSSASFSQVPGYLALAKAAIFFIKPAYSKIASSPTKMAECWAMNLPIITNPGIGDNDFFFNSHNGGILVNGFNKQAYLEAGKKYLSLQKETAQYREIALEFFDNRKAIEKYTGIYNKVVASKL